MRGWQTMPTASAIPPQMHQEFAVALRPQDRGGYLAGDEVSVRFGKLPELAQDPTVLFGIADHATLSHRPLADLELGFDQGDDVTRRAEQLADTRQHQPQGDERDVDHRQVRRDGQPIEMADVDALQHDHPWVLTKAPGQLTVADVDRDHRAGPARKQHVGKAARRRADVEAHPPRWIDAEGIEGGRELFAAATDELLGPGEVDTDIGADQLVRAVRDLARHTHQPGTHHGLSPLPRRHEPLGHEHLVQADPALDHQRHIPSPTIIPSKAPAITSIGVCPSSSRNRSWRMPWCAMNKSSINRFRIMACWPAARRTPVASYMTTVEKISAMAKSGDPTPSSRPMIVVRATTRALCELGIPPAVASRRTLNRCSRTESMITLHVWAIAQAIRGTTKYGFRSRVTGPADARRPAPTPSAPAQHHRAAGRNGVPAPAHARRGAQTRPCRPAPFRVGQRCVRARRPRFRNPSGRSQQFPSPLEGR